VTGVTSDNLVRGIDTICLRRAIGHGIVEVCESATAVEKTMLLVSAVEIEPDDLARLIDAEGDGRPVAAYRRSRAVSSVASRE